MEELYDVMVYDDDDDAGINTEYRFFLIYNHHHHFHQYPGIAYLSEFERDERGG